MKIKVIDRNNESYIEVYQNQTISEALLEKNIFIPNICHGNGTCGKCKIKVVKGYLPITEADERNLTENELEQGIRLACKADIGINSEELWIEIAGETEEDIDVERISTKKITKEFSRTNQCHFIVIDIGTTTIAMTLVNAETGEIIDVYTSVNHQRKYGADVISRITAANAGKTAELKRLIEEDLQKGLATLTGVWDKIIIAGNTTMIHLLMGYSCESLGKYPFVSEHLGQIQCTLKECIGSFEEHENVPVTILPGISTFVGGDIVADILACEGFETEEICLLLDLGTNGEIVLGNKHKILTTSTAVGPAFEGGNIICGAAAIPGSICQVKIQNQRAVVRTIKNEMPPKGICGTGLISTVAQLISNQMVSENGVLKKPYDEKGISLWTFENGEKITLYQKDIREFQMAKAAIRAGIEILVEEYGCAVAEVKKVYIAGGFGKAFNVEDMIVTGILPKEFRNKINIIGNGVLQGAALYGNNIKTENNINNICQRAENIALSQNDTFKEKYIEYMKL